MFRKIKATNIMIIEVDTLGPKLACLKYPNRVFLVKGLPTSVTRWVILHEKTHIYCQHRSTTSLVEEIIASIPPLICYPFTTLYAIWLRLKSYWRYKYARSSL